MNEKKQPEDPIVTPAALTDGLVAELERALSRIESLSAELRTGNLDRDQERDALRGIDAAARQARDCSAPIPLLLPSRQAARERAFLQDLFDTALCEYSGSGAPEWSASIEQRGDFPSQVVIIDIRRFSLVLTHLIRHAAQLSSGTDCAPIELNLGQLQVAQDNDRPHPDLEAGPYAHLTVAIGVDVWDGDQIREAFSPQLSVLGLPLVNRLTSDAGGAVTINSDPGHGTRIQVFFPYSLPIEANETRGDVESLAREILILSGEPKTTSEFQELFRGLGYDVATKSSLSRAMGAVDENPGRFDIVICDHQMPDWNGLDHARQLRNVHPDLTIVLVTDYRNPVSRIAIEKAGIRAHLRKPLVAHQVSERLDRLR